MWTPPNRPAPIEPAADDMKEQGPCRGEGGVKGQAVAAATSGFEDCGCVQYSVTKISAVQATVSILSSGSCEIFIIRLKNSTNVGPTGCGEVK